MNTRRFSLSFVGLVVLFHYAQVAHAGFPVDCFQSKDDGYHIA